MPLSTRPHYAEAELLTDWKIPTDCGSNTNQMANANPLEEVALPIGAHQIDMLEQVCPEGMTSASNECPAVVGNVVVWYDGSHLTNQYVATMTPILETKLREEASWLFQK